MPLSGSHKLLTFQSAVRVCLTLACLVKIFSSDKAPPAKLYFVYCEPAQRRMAEKDYQEAFFTPGIWPL